jgi:Putative peptidoglycan binding domain
VSEVLARIRSDSILSRSAGASKSGRNLARILVQRMKALRPRTYVAAALSALLVGIGVNALVLQSHRHPAPLFAPPPPRVSPPPAPVNLVPAPPAAASTETSTPIPAPPPPPKPTGAVASPPRAPDQIGNLLRSEVQTEDTHLVVAAQTALVKLGYAVKADGAEGAATQQALRDFERAHGLPLSTEITPRLVKQLNAAARNAAR